MPANCKITAPPESGTCSEDSGFASDYFGWLSLGYDPLAHPEPEIEFDLRIHW